jgi:hypothetical protein
MKQPWEWDEDDLLTLIKLGEKESLQLEYKACDALGLNDEKKKTEVSKDVSAFANSAGGTIIYGMVEVGNVPVRIDSGYDPNVITREWLEQVIHSRIQRRIDGLVIKQVPLPVASNGKVAYVVYIPASRRAPHQASDKRFYKRFNFQSVMMEEYEIRDVSRRDEAPDLNLKFDLVPAVKREGNESLPNPALVQLMVLISNGSPRPVEYCVINVHIDSRLKLPSGFGRFCGSGVNELLIEGRSVSFCCFSLNWSVPALMPIWEGMPFQVFEHPQPVEIPDEGRFAILWGVRSPGMAARSGEVFLQWDGRTASLLAPQAGVDAK